MLRKNGCFSNSHKTKPPPSPKGMFFQRLFLQIILAAKWQVRHSSMYNCIYMSPKQQRRLCLLFCLILLYYGILILIPSVLVPGLDLGIGEVQLGGQLHPVLNGQVLLPLEGALQGLQLLVREGGARFPLLLHVVGVRMPRVVFACIKAAIQYQT